MKKTDRAAWKGREKLFWLRSYPYLSRAGDRYETHSGKHKRTAYPIREFLSHDTEQKCAALLRQGALVAVGYDVAKLARLRKLGR